MVNVRYGSCVDGARLFRPWDLPRPAIVGCRGRSGRCLSGAVRTVHSHEQKWEGRANSCPTPPICRLSLAGEARYIGPSSFRVRDAFQIGFFYSTLIIMGLPMSPTWKTKSSRSSVPLRFLPVIAASMSSG